jgi:large subunit ribosomal protein L29
MNATELKGLSLEELVQKERETRAELFNAKVKHATGQLEDTARLKVLRRDIARVATILHERGEAEK